MTDEQSADYQRRADALQSAHHGVAAAASALVVAAAGERDRSRFEQLGQVHAALIDLERVLRAVRGVS